MSPADQYLDDMRALSMQLNRQAFAQPPIEGWLNSFLTLLCERFAPVAVRGVQVVQAIGNVAVRMAGAGDVPASASDTYALDDQSPLAAALRARQMVTSPPNLRLYPILIGSDPLGVLIVYTDQDTPVLDSLLTSLALQLGPALLQHLKSPGPQTDRLTRQIQLMRSLYEVTKNVSSALESTEVVNRTARSLVDVLHVDHVSLTVFDASKQKGSVIAEYPERGFAGTTTSFPAVLYQQLDQYRKPIVINDVDHLAETHPQLVGTSNLNYKAVAFVPMIVQNDLIGVITLEMDYDAREFTPEEIEGSVAITTQLAISIRNAQLYDEIKHRASQLERITDLSRRVMSTFDRNRIFQIVQEETHKLIDADLISVALRQPNDPILYLFTLGDKEPAVTEFQADQTALRLITAQSLVLDDISGSEYPDYKLLAQARMRAVAIVPLIVGGRTFGTYNILHRQVGYYSALDLVVLEQIGNQLAIALENARLYAETAQRAETERLLNQLSGSTQGRGDIESALQATVQQIAEALGARRARVRLQMPTVPTPEKRERDA